MRAILSWHFHSKYFSSILSPRHIFASVQLHSVFKKKIVPTQPNNSSSIWSCFLLGSNKTDAISLNRKDTPEPPTPGTKKVCHVFGGGDRGRSSLQSYRWRQEDREQGISAFLFTIVFHTQERQSFTLLPRINTSGSKINIKRNSTSREFQHHLQISSCPQFTRKKGSGAPFDESIEGLGNSTLSIDRFHCSQIRCTESMGKNSHRTATVKATRGQNKIIRELQGNAMSIAIKKKKRLNKKNVANVYSSSQVLIWAQNKIQQIIKQKSDRSGHHVTYKMFKHCFSLFLYTINGHLEPPTALASSHLARYYHTQSQSKFFWKTIYSIFYFKNMDTSEFRTIWFPVRKKCTQRQRTACQHRSLCFTYSASS